MRHYFLKYEALKRKKQRCCLNHLLEKVQFPNINGPAKYDTQEIIYY